MGVAVVGFKGEQGGGDAVVAVIAVPITVIVVVGDCIHLQKRGRNDGIRYSGTHWTN